MHTDVCDQYDASCNEEDRSSENVIWNTYDDDFYADDDNSKSNGGTGIDRDYTNSNGGTGIEGNYTNLNSRTGTDGDYTNSNGETGKDRDSTNSNSGTGTERDYLYKYLTKLIKQHCRNRKIKTHHLIRLKRCDLIFHLHSIMCFKS